jgi:hypothetical protein
VNFIVAMALSWLLFLSAEPALGDILFLDFNDSPSEVEAATRAALLRGEKLRVFPAEAGESRRQVRALQKEFASEKAQVLRLCPQDVEPDEACRSAYDRQMKVYNELHTLSDKVKKIDGPSLARELQSLRGQGVNLTSLVISGHDGDREFWGMYGSIKDKEIEEAFLANPPMAEGVRSLYLWNCYSATTDDFLNGWKRAFPNAMLAGYPSQGPKGSRPASGRLLEDMLKKEEGFLQTRDREELGRIFNSLSEVNSVRSAICLDRETVVTNGSVHSIADDIDACSRKTKEEVKWSGIYDCYMRARPGCEATPPEGDNQSDLRQSYNYFQETKHCEEVLQRKGQARGITSLSARVLVFEKTIRKNFASFHEKELAEMDALLDELGVDPSLRVQEMGKLSRREYLDLIKGIKQEWNTQKQALKDRDGLVSDSRVEALGYYLDELEKVQSAKCIPGTWIEDTNEFDESPCGIRRGMSSARQRATQAIQSQRLPVPPIDE